MTVTRIDPEHPLWASLAAFFHECNQARSALTEDDLPKHPDLIFFGVVIEGEVIGQLCIKKQPIMMPASEWAGERDRRLLGPDREQLYETFVQTFAVHPDYRNKGYGQALQQAALKATAEIGCIQMRSWSSLDKKSNYQLKLKLGFGFHPEIQETASGLRVSGGYFIKRVD